jgi:hypothetical protein
MIDLFLDNKNIKIPKYIMEIKYNFKIIPNWWKYNILKTGSNCQVFSFELLRFNNKYVPDFRSSELWVDKEYSKIVKQYKPLDILFFNKDNNPYWAHLWVYIWWNKIVHNSKDIWKPIIWDIEEFKKYKNYNTIIWAKRFFE